MSEMEIPLLKVNDDGVPEDAQSRGSAALVALIKELDAGRVHLYRNVLGKPHIEFRLDGHPKRAFYLLHDDVRAWLMDFFWRAGVGLLHKGELDRILTYLAGRSLRYPCHDVDAPALLQALQTEPVLAVAVEFMHIRPSEKHENTMGALWKEWRDFAEERKLLTLGRKRFPGGANVLSRELRRLTPLLRTLGLIVEIRRSDGSQVTITRRLDDSPAEPSAQSSATNALPETDLRHADDHNARLSRLRERQGQRAGQEDA
jgi:hypothetical protein